MAFVCNPLPTPSSFARPSAPLTKHHQTPAPLLYKQRRRVRVGPAVATVRPSWRCTAAPSPPGGGQSDGDGDVEVEETVSLSELNARLSAAAAPEVASPDVVSPNIPPQDAPQAEREVMTDEEDEVEDTRSEKQKEIDRLRAAEKFIQVDEGKFECTGCGFVYEPEKGDRQNSIAAGTPFEQIPESYTCPVCRTPKRRFVSRKKVIAGFAENQTYGLGSNQMTGGEKSLLIFGGLAACALLLLSGYAMN